MGSIEFRIDDGGIKIKPYDKLEAKRPKDKGYLVYRPPPIPRLTSLSHYYQPFFKDDYFNYN